MTMYRPLVLLICLLPALARPAAEAQPMQLGEWLFLAGPIPGEGVDAQGFEARLNGPVDRAWLAGTPSLDLHLFKGDRGEHEGSYLISWSSETSDGNAVWQAVSNPPQAQRDALAAFGVDEPAVAGYRLIGADAYGPLPQVGILGVHVLHVKPDRAKAFDAFVEKTLHPAFATSLPGMPLLYYKGAHGSARASALLIWAIASDEAREAYFPAGKPETDALRAVFSKLKEVGQELVTYLEEGTWLDPSTGAIAAYFESLEWTDYMLVEPAWK